MEQHLPEALSPIVEYSYKDLEEARRLNSTVNVFVTCYVNSGSFLIVRIPGLNIYGHIPINEVSIYSLKKEEGYVSANLYSLIGRYVSCKILNLEKRIFSRKANMLEAFYELSTREIHDRVYIMSLTAHNAFVDVGAGLLGKISIVNFSTCRFRTLSDIGFAPEQEIPAKTLFIDSFKRFELSYKETFPAELEVFSKGDIIECKVGNTVENSPSGEGHFVFVTPNVSGIVDSPRPLTYASEIMCVISKVTSKGLRLKFLFEV